MASKSQTPMIDEAFVREMNEAIWGADGSPEAVDEYFAADVVAHEPGETLEGIEAYKALETSLREGMPDLEGTADLVVCEGDFVTVHYTATGTHTGDLWGIEPTGNEMTTEGITVYRFEDGKVAESWHQYDRLGAFQQLGIVPEMG